MLAKFGSFNIKAADEKNWGYWSESVRLNSCVKRGKIHASAKLLTNWTRTKLSNFSRHVRLTERRKVVNPVYQPLNYS